MLRTLSRLTVDDLSIGDCFVLEPSLFVTPMRVIGYGRDGKYVTIFLEGDEFYIAPYGRVVYRVAQDGGSSICRIP